MKRVEFTNLPPKFEILEQRNGNVLLLFYDEAKEVVKEDGLTSYETICYEMQTRNAANLHSRIEKNYSAWLEKAKEKDGGLTSVKAQRIHESKAKLAEYLASHPLVSDVHGGRIGIYSVTEEKQTLMMSQYISYQAEKMLNPNAVLTWNETGKACEPWTEEEFVQLVSEIRNYVYPRVSHQQTLEEEISAATTLDEVEAVVIQYETI